MRLVIGSGTYVNRFTMFDASEHIEVGRNCLIGPFCYITDHDHGNEQPGLIAEQPLVGRPVRIGSNVWVGAGAIILKGVTIEDGAIIGAGAVVTRDVRSGEKVVGVPARALGSRLKTASDNNVHMTPPLQKRSRKRRELKKQRQWRLLSRSIFKGMAVLSVLEKNSNVRPQAIRHPALSRSSWGLGLAFEIAMRNTYFLWEIFRKRNAFRNVRQIRMEYHLDLTHTMADFEAIISELGFKVTRLIPNRNFGIAWLDNVDWLS